MKKPKRDRKPKKGFMSKFLSGGETGVDPIDETGPINHEIPNKVKDNKKDKKGFMGRLLGGSKESELDFSEPGEGKKGKGDDGLTTIERSRQRGQEHDRRASSFRNLFKQDETIDLSGKSGDAVEEATTSAYSTTLLDRFASKINMEYLDIDANFGVHDDVVISGEGYQKIYNVIKLPSQIFYSRTDGYFSTIFDSISMKRGMEDVSFFYESFNRPYHVQFGKDTSRNRDGLINMAARLERGISLHEGDVAESSIDREIRKMGSVDVLRFRLEEANKKLQSHSIIRANQNRGSHQIESFQFIRVVAKTREELAEAEKDLIQTLHGLDVRLRQVKSVMDYLQTFSPVSGLTALKDNNTYVSSIFTTHGYPKIRHNPTRILETEQANMSRLIYVGSVVDNDEPLALTFTSTGEGQNALVVGATGSGKTYLFQNLALNSNLNDFRLNLMDYKGNEYNSLAHLIGDAVIIDFSARSSNYVNTLKFYPELYSDNMEEQKAEYAETINETATSLCILAGLKEEELKAGEATVGYMLEQILGNHKVNIKDPNTYHRSHNVSFRYDLRAQLPQLKSVFMRETFGQKICDTVYVGLFPYLDENSSRAHIFNNEIDLIDVVQKRCIVYSFHMNERSPWDSLMDYKIYIQDYITNMYVKTNKEQGFTTLNSIEEYQRAVRSPYSRKIYNNKFSGGRSDNVISIIMSNTLAPLMADDLDIAAIRENISNLFIGKITDKNILGSFCEVYGLDYNNMMDINNLDYLDHAFFCSYDTGVQRGTEVIRVVHPPEIERMFETKRIDEVGEFQDVRYL